MDAERPDVRTVVDVLVDPDGEPLTSVVHVCAADELVVAVGCTRDGRRVRYDVGTPLELRWKTPGSLLRLPVELTEVHLGEDPTWRLRVAGGADVVQRRDAVRAPLRLSLSVDAGGAAQNGWAIDLSENGLRCVLGAAPTDEAGGRGPREPGDTMTVHLDLPDGRLDSEVALVRTHPRADRRWEVSLSFTDLGERAEDRVRTAVFARLREIRAAGHS